VDRHPVPDIQGVSDAHRSSNGDPHHLAPGRPHRLQRRRHSTGRRGQPQAAAPAQQQAPAQGGKATEELLTGDIKQKAEAAALAQFLGTVVKSENDAEKPGMYAVEIKQAYGKNVGVYLDQSFAVSAPRTKARRTAPAPATATAEPPAAPRADPPGHLRPAGPRGPLRQPGDHRGPDVQRHLRRYRDAAVASRS
jgi:hypothetical protein